MIHTLVVKSIRACNLRCTYCYYINDDTPQYGLKISEETLTRLYETYGAYLAEQDGRGALIWHGGEPLLLGRKRFQRYLDLQREYFPEGRLQNRLQTNGALISDEWIDFLIENDVQVGISLDGPREVHDRFRVDTKGRGSYDDTIRGIERLRARGVKVAVLSVAGAWEDGGSVLRHFRDELDLKGADFLLPIRNHALARGDGLDMASIGRFLEQAFEEWTSRDEDGFRVRLFEALVLNALGIPHNYFASGATQMGDVAVVETTGEICMDTDFGQIDRFLHGEEYKSGFHLHDPSFQWKEVERVLGRRLEAVGADRVPTECQTCRIRSVCRGGHPASRFDDADGGFDHRSAHCGALFPVSERVVEHLVRKGLGDHLADADLRKTLKQESSAGSEGMV